MKKFIPFTLLALTMSGAAYSATKHTNNSTVDYLQVRHDIAYQVNHTTPFSGTLLQHYDNGQNAIKVAFVKGKKVGKEQAWYANGQLSAEAKYHHGQLDGLAHSWYENGQLAETIHYAQGKRTGHYQEWDSNGQQISDLNYKNDQLDGKATLWYSNGKKRFSGHFKQGLKSGVINKFYANGHKALEATYSHGHLADGKLTRYNLAGKKVYQQTIKDHKVVSEQEWMS